VERTEAISRLRAARVGRLATLRPDGRPHVVPFVFALREEGERLFIYWAVDRKPKRSSTIQRLRNIAANPHVELVVDAYDEDWERVWWVRASGSATQVTDPNERTRGLAVLADKYRQYVEAPPEGPVVVIEIAEVAGWQASPGTSSTPFSS
jgi:PPOX class probable F420-dependent enzyme